MVFRLFQFFSWGAGADTYAPAPTPVGVADTRFKAIKAIYEGHEMVKYPCVDNDIREQIGAIMSQVESDPADAVAILDKRLSVYFWDQAYELPNPTDPQRSVESELFDKAFCVEEFVGLFNKSALKETSALGPQLRSASCEQTQGNRGAHVARMSI